MAFGSSELQLPEAVLIDPARQLLTGEPYRPADPYMWKTTRTSQLVNSARPNMEQLRSLMGIEQGFLKQLRYLPLVSLCPPQL